MEEIGIKVKVEGGDATADIKKINDGLKDVQATADKTSNKVGQAMKGFSESTEAVTGSYVALQSVMLLANQDSEEMAKIMSKIVAVQGLFNAVKMIGNSLMMENNILTRAGAIATGIYSAVQKALTTATSGTSVAMKVLRLAMLALPILLIIAGLTALVMWLVKLADASAEVEEANNALTASYEKLSKANDAYSEKAERDINNRIKLAQSEDATRQELFELEIERINTIEQARKTTMSTELNMINERRKQYKEALEAGNEELAISIKEEIGQHRKKYEDLKKLDGQAGVDLKVLENKNNSAIQKEEDDAQKKRTDAQKQAYEKRKAEREKQQAEKLAKEQAHQADLLAVQQASEDLLLNNIKDASMREEAVIRLSYERRIATAREKYGAESDIEKQLLINRNEEIRQLQFKLEEESFVAESELRSRLNVERANLELQEIQSNNAQKLALTLEDIELEFQAQQELLEQQKIQELENLELTEEERELIKERYRQQEIAMEREKEQKITDEKEKEIQARLDLQNRAFESLNALNDLAFSLFSANAEKGSKQEEKLARKKFAINKALQLTQATITGVQSVLTAFNSGLAVPIIGPATGAIYAVGAGVVAAANIAKIASSKFEPSGGGGGGGGSASMPSAPNVADVGAGLYNNSLPKMSDVNGTSKPDSVKVMLTDSDLKASEKNNKKVDLISRG